MKPPLPAPTRRRGFTLLEILIAIAILSLVSVTLYRFVDTTLRAASYSERSGNEDAALNGLRRLVSSQLAALPANQDSTLVGMTVAKDGARRDAMQMVCPAGNAVLTPDAHGFYQVTLGVREQPRGSGHLALGLEREPWSDESEADANDASGASALPTTDLRAGRSRTKLPADWIKLMDHVTGLDVAYFDARLNSWVDRWTDPRTLPNLVRVRLGTEDRGEPYEIVARVPGGGIQRVVLAPTAPGVLPGVPGAPNAANGVVPGQNGRTANLPKGVPALPNFTPPPPPPNFSSPPLPLPPFNPQPIPGNTGPGFGHQ